VSKENLLLSILPQSLRDCAYVVGDEPAWPRGDALRVVDVLAREGLGVCGVEIWLPGKDAPTIPTPIIYTWEAVTTQGAWRPAANEAAKEYIGSFAWDPRDIAHLSSAPYFNIEAY
jgi:hypothetical protein